MFTAPNDAPSMRAVLVTNPHETFETTLSPEPATEIDGMSEMLSGTTRSAPADVAIRR